MAEKNKDVTITVNNREIAVPKETTGAEIKSLAGVPLDFQLFREEGDNEILVADDEKIKVHKHQRFTASSTLDPS